MSLHNVVRALVLALLGAAVTPSGAAACTIVESTPRFRVERATVALTAQVVGVRVLRREPGSGRDFYEAVLRTEKVYRGAPGPAIRIRANTSGAECGFGPVAVGERRGLLLDGPRGPWDVSATSKVSGEELEDLHAGPAWGLIAGAAAGAVAIVVIGATLRRRRSQGSMSPRRMA